MKLERFKTNEPLLKERIEEILEDKGLNIDYYEYPMSELIYLRKKFRDGAFYLTHNNNERNFVLYSGPLDESYFLGLGFFADINISRNRESKLMEEVINEFDIKYPDFGLNNRIEERFDKKEFDLEYRTIYLRAINESLRDICQPVIIVSQSLPFKDNCKIISYSFSND